MHTIFDAAQVILQKKGSMTTMKLQKLLYYAQAWSLVWDGHELFFEDCEAWAGGPVYPALYDWRKPDETVELSLIPQDRLTPEPFTIDQEETIDAILRDYADRDADWLSELTHMEEPWRKARGDHAPGDYCHNVIPKESMASFYDKISKQEEVCND